MLENPAERGVTLLKTLCVILSQSDIPARDLSYSRIKNPMAPMAKRVPVVVRTILVFMLKR